MPAVSVIMLNWNHGPWLVEAVRSVLAQSFTDLELIVIDNGSTDGSVDQLQRAVTDPRLRLFTEPVNRGISTGINLAIAHATASWIALTDGDDRSHPLRLELQLKALAADRSLDAIATDAETIDQAGTVTGRIDSTHSPEAIRGQAPFGMPVVNPTLLARAEWFRRLEYRPAVRWAPDYDFVLRLLEAGARVGALSLPLYSYRRHPHSSTVAMPLAHELGTCAIRLAAARRRAGRPERIDEAFATVDARLAAGMSLGTAFRLYADDFRAEGFPLLAAFHSALAQRVAPSAGTKLRFARDLIAAVRADAGSWREALGGMAKGPFWLMLRRAGFPVQPRY
ncbi:glycosyltransferase [Opitutus sp. ER46]|uniref:glycosyltransferase family 2 protein n=1 Tax=Opitutus sp. ER46 TaxID=2161864 RepID=UPI000D313A5A|nr:glycosyltransferase [Opitutus sp. ER46]PTX95629.1 hypothetical protein DB354_09440 [Opitutus sp. ER46]